MGLTAAVCTSYKSELLQGIHLAADTYKIALIKPSPSGTLDATVTNYTALSTDEIANGSGYTTGGATLTGFAAAISGTTAFLDFADATWSASTIVARGALIYNSSRSNKACFLVDFGATITSTADTFTYAFPVADASNAIIRL